MNESKTCTKCGQTKQIIEFGKGNGYKGYRRSQCKKCLSLYSKAYAQANQEKMALNQKLFRSTNGEQIAAKNREYKQANPEKVRVNSQLRRARTSNSGVFKVTAKEIAKLYASPCAYCGAPSKHLDHIIPISRGGTHGIGNLTGACAKCNQSKSDKFITEWKS